MDTPTSLREQHVVGADFTAGRPKPHPHRRPRTRDRPYTVHHGPSIELKTRLCNELTSGLYRAPFSVVPSPVLKQNSRTPFSVHARPVWCTAAMAFTRLKLFTLVTNVHQNEHRTEHGDRKLARCTTWFLTPWTMQYTCTLCPKQVGRDSIRDVS